MINYSNLRALLCFIESYNGIADKSVLANRVKDKFGLTLDRKIYYCTDYAIRFSQANSKNFSNTVLSLSALQKYDNRPVIVCVVMPQENYLLLCNSTCLKKISHSSQQLRTNNIKGSFNGSDILRTVADIENTPENFVQLFAIHQEYTFEENLERLVEATNNIVAHGHKFMPSVKQLYNIENAPFRAEAFLNSQYFSELDHQLQERVNIVKNEIAIAAFIENVNLKGNIIEYLITSDASATRNMLIDALANNKPIPYIKNANDLGDYNVDFVSFDTKTDIKTKVLFLTSNPKGYNIDKLLEFLAEDKSVYLLFFVGIDSNKEISTVLCPVFDIELIRGTALIKHWAGRNSRGVAQFLGEQIRKIIINKKLTIDKERAKNFISELLSL